MIFTINYQNRLVDYSGDWQEELVDYCEGLAEQTSGPQWGLAE